MSRILTEHSREADARARLRRARAWALGLLLLAAALFVLSSVLLGRYPALGYLKAFAEAAMVGALADWFAVTALFRHPLGLKIPHTAILPRSQTRIAEELGRFIENNFLLGRPIALRVYRMHPSDRLLAWFTQKESLRVWLPALAAKLPVLLRIAKPEHVARFATQLLAEQYSGDKIGKASAEMLGLLRSQGLHQVLLTAGLAQLRRWLHQPETRALLEANLLEWAQKIESDKPDTWARLKAQLKGTLVGQVDGWVAQKALDWADSYAAAALADEQHPLRTGFEEQYAALMQSLSESPEWHRRLESGKQQLAASPALYRQCALLWQGLIRWSERDVRRADSLTVAQLTRLLRHMQHQADAYPQFMRRIDARIALLVRDAVERYKHRGAQFVAEKVKSWDSRQMTDKLELSVGRDLQFIRINGTLVGGLVGLLIYTVSRWLAQW